jgi:hypothetical protein
MSALVTVKDGHLQVLAVLAVLADVRATASIASA